MKTNNFKVLITGADGFIGSHLTEFLVQNGYDVTAFVYYNSFNSYGWLDSIPSETKSNIEFFAGDIRDPSGVREAMKGVDIVFHLAALADIVPSVNQPKKYFRHNVIGSFNLVNLCKEYNVKKLIYKKI